MRSWLLALSLLVVFPSAALAQRPDVLAGLGSVAVLIGELDEVYSRRWCERRKPKDSGGTPPATEWHSRG